MTSDQPGPRPDRGRWDLSRPAVLAIGGLSFVAVGVAGIAGLHGLAQWLVGAIVLVLAAVVALALPPR